MKATKNVVGIHEDTRDTRWFRPGDDIPEEFRASITNPAAYEDGEGEDPPGDEDEVEDDVYSQATNDELRAELANRGLPVHGNKPELVARLREDDAADTA